MGGSNTVGGIFSGHLDGQIRAWLPQLEGADDEIEDKYAKDGDEVRSKKRKALDDAYRSLMGKQVTYS
jgi:DNA excision repair protein ERCC-8